MPSKDEALAEVFDTLIRHDSGKIPSEVGDMVQIGLRLHNECPEIDPGFQARLGARLDAQWAQVQRVRPRRARSAVAPWAGTMASPALVRSLAVSLAVVSLILAPALVIPQWRAGVQASFGGVISIFREAQFVQEPQSTSATPPAPSSRASYRNLAAAQVAAGHPLRLPNYLPEGMEFVRAEISTVSGLQRVTLHYEGSALVDFRDRSGSLSIMEYVVASPEEAAFQLHIGLDSAEPVQVAGRTGLWVSGRWTTSGKWMRTPNEGALWLQDGPVLVTISSNSGRAEILRVAESMFK